MPLPLLIPLAIGAAGAIGSAIGNVRAQKKANELNITQQERANTWNIEQWNRQNAYNTPTAQMERLKAAGLNPNLVYGQGASGATGQAGSIPSAKAAPQGANNALQNLHNFANVAQQVATTNNLRKQADVLDKQVGNIQADTLNKLQNVYTSQYDLKYKKEVENLRKNLLMNEEEQSYYMAKESRRVDYAKTWTLDSEKPDSSGARLSEYQKGLIADYQRQIENKRGAQLENEIKSFEANMSKYGITRNSPLWAKALALLVDKAINGGKLKMLTDIIK